MQLPFTIVFEPPGGAELRALARARRVWTITAAGFLADGRIALTLALPQGSGQQLWLLDGPRGLRRLGPPETRSALALAPDGQRVAFLAEAPRGGAPSGRTGEVWVSGPDG